MKANASSDKVPELMTVDEWTGKTKAWKESTSTSSSGFHWTHSEASVSDHDIDVDSEEGMLLEDKCQQLMRWQVTTMNLAIKNRHSHERWKTTVNVVLLKDPDDL